ncbi:hypothetical protein GQ42DRAFT_166066, partial [Ramicandelaber brevisporus]
TNYKPFALPYDLIEEISTYFSRRETVLLLTVNNQFHSVLARAIWRKICLDDSLINHIPASAWQTYGHLVRFATVELYESHEHLDAIRMPNVVDLTLYLMNRGYNIFDGVGLNNLQRLYLNLPSYGWTSFADINGVELARRLERSGHPITVYWDIHVETQKQVAALNGILAPIADTSSHSFKITARSMHSVHLQHLSKLAEMLTELDLSGPLFVLNDLPGDPVDFFPRLVKLNLRYVEFNEDDPVGLNVLIPDRFPVLQHLTIDSLSSFDLGWLEILFSRDWPSITELTFPSCNSSLEVATIASHVPNLRRLIVNGYSSVLDINQATEHWSHLQYLEIDNSVRFEYSASSKPWPQLANLKSFVYKPIRELYQFFIRQHVLDFILHGAPNLESIELKQGYFSKNALRVGQGRVNPSVHTLDIEIGSDRFNVVAAKTFIEMFPNLKLLKVRSKDSIAGQLLKEYPKLDIQFY